MRIRLFAAILGVLATLGLTACDPATEPTPVQGAESKGAKAAGGKAKAVPIKLAARRARPAKSVLSSGMALSCVKATVTNQSKKNVEVNLLYFSLTDTTGTKHDVTDAMAEYEDAIDTTTLAPREKATGLVCAKGKFVPKIVAMTNPLFSEAARAKVA